MNFWGIISLLTLFQSVAVPERTASIEGVVVKLGSSEAVSKVNVELYAAEDRGTQLDGAITGTDGKFAFRNLRPGSYRIFATRPGYVRTELGQRGPNGRGVSIRLAPRQELKDVFIRLVPTGSIYGRVRDPDGEPLANVEVRAMKAIFRDGRRILTAVQTVLTNDFGEYRLFWLAPGRYFVCAVRPLTRVSSGPDGSTVELEVPGKGYGSRFVSRGEEAFRLGNFVPTPKEETYLPVYFPATTDARMAATIDVSPGSSYGNVDFTIFPVRQSRVRGVLFNAVTGQPTNGSVSLVPLSSESGLPGRLSNASGGSFEIVGVSPGAYLLTGESSGMRGGIPLQVGGTDLENVAVSVVPGYTFPARIIMEGTTGRPRSLDFSAVKIILQSQIPDLFNETYVPSADGSLILSEVAPGDYRVFLSSIPSNSYVKSIRLGSMDILNDGLHINEPPQVPMEVVLGNDSGLLDGFVLEERRQPAANVTVTLMPTSPGPQRQALYHTAVTDQAGHFQIQGITPGDYKILAWEDIENGAWFDSDFMQLYEDRVKLIHIGPGTAKIELTVIPPR